MPAVRSRGRGRTGAAAPVGPGRSSRDAGPGVPSGSHGPPYKPISDYGVIGNLETVALVGTDGSIDWCCLPHFDSPSVFAALLDRAKGGRFRLGPVEEGTKRQLYLPDTNVLITRFLGRHGVAEVIDFMPIRGEGPDAPRTGIFRRASAIRGEVELAVECRPAFDYARELPIVRRVPGGARFEGTDVSLALASSVPLVGGATGVTARFPLKEGESASFILECAAAAGGTAPIENDGETLRRALEATVQFWRRWISRSTYRGRWREVVARSALALKLLTFAPSGAIIAAPTCGLPEVVGGERNWDYRYAWIRDAAFTVYAFLRLGFTEEAGGFMRWLLARASDVEPNGSLRPMYRIEGGHDLPEETLGHLEGYRGSRPVRIGNGAVDQLQLDLYGPLLDAAYLYNKYGTPISYDLWTKLRGMVDWLTQHWRTPDRGIWEMRRGPAHFVHSMVMGWVALDRAIRIAEKRGLPADLDRWRSARDTIYEHVMHHGWNESRGSFVQYVGGTSLDASNLLMPLVFFVSPHDPRMRRTLEAIERELVSDSLVRRYSAEETDDGLSGEEGTFSLCSFWYVEALTRAGRLPEARLVFEKMLGYANHLGLYSEEIDTTGESLGNFPQALTHLALISAAVNLDRALGDSGL